MIASMATLNFSLVKKHLVLLAEGLQQLWMNRKHKAVMRHHFDHEE